MKAKIFLTATLLFIPLAKAGTYPLLNEYREVATEMAGLTKTAASPTDYQQLLEGQRKLVTLGGQMMALYGEKNPNCKPQFDVYLSEMGTMESKSLDELHDRYHTGTGLPAAPRHCYLARSQIVHPSMNVKRILLGWSETVRNEIADETKEVIEHLVRLERNLDNPPN